MGQSTTHTPARATIRREVAESSPKMYDFARTSRDLSAGRGGGKLRIKDVIEKEEFDDYGIGDVFEDRLHLRQPGLHHKPTISATVKILSRAELNKLIGSSVYENVGQANERVAGTIKEFKRGPDKEIIGIVLATK